MVRLSVYSIYEQLKKNYKNPFPQSVVKIPVYHGTARVFDKFERGDLGFHFGNQKQANKVFRNRKNQTNFSPDKSFNIKPVWINIKKPLILPDVQGWSNPKMVANALIEKGFFDAEDWKNWQSQFHMGDTFAFQQDILLNKMKKIIKRKGYDGIKYRNEHEGKGWSYIVFDNTQIKSIFEK